MKVELHLHTSRYSACSVNSPEEMMDALVAAGYGAVFITEHNEVWSDEELNDLRACFPAIRIFPGMELNTGPAQQQHLLVLGSNDPAYLRMADDVPGVLERSEEDGCLTVLAHPYRYEGGAAMLDEGLRPDAMELRTSNHNADNAARAKATARKLGIALVNAGDTHSTASLDRFWIETAGPLTDARQLRQMVRAGKYVNRVRG